MELTQRNLDSSRMGLVLLTDGMNVHVNFDDDGVFFEFFRRVYQDARGTVYEHSGDYSHYENVRDLLQDNPDFDGYATWVDGVTVDFM